MIKIDAAAIVRNEAIRIRKREIRNNLIRIKKLKEENYNIRLELEKL
jgi:hypothetical protein